MRVDQIISINATTQQSQRTMQYEGTSNNKAVQSNSFAEHLNAALQQVNNAKIINQAESHLPGLLMGYFTNLKVPNKPEPKLKENIS